MFLTFDIFFNAGAIFLWIDSSQISLHLDSICRVLNIQQISVACQSFIRLYNIQVLLCQNKIKLKMGTVSQL